MNRLERDPFVAVAMWFTKGTSGGGPKRAREWGGVTSGAVRIEWFHKRGRRWRRLPLDRQAGRPSDGLKPQLASPITG